MPNQYEFFVECASGGDVENVIEVLKNTMVYCSVVSRNGVHMGEDEDSKGMKLFPYMSSLRLIVRSSDIFIQVHKKIKNKSSVSTTKTSDVRIKDIFFRIYQF